MQTHVSKWGNSLGLRLPKSFAEELGGQGALVEIHLKAGKLIIEPSVKRRYKLENLLSQVTPDNLHDAVDDGPSVGNEAW